MHKQSVTMVLPLSVSVAYYRAPVLLKGVCSMTFSATKELFWWIVGTVLMGVLFVNSHTFYVTQTTFYYGLALSALFIAMLWTKLRPRPVSAPMWLRITSSLCFTMVVFFYTMYLLGVATFYE
jgi:hypothetical protein